MLESEADVEDAAQEALLRGWRHRATLRDPSAYLPWLASIARREALRIAARRVPLPATAEDVPSYDERLDGVERRIDLGSVLAQLPDDDRTLLRLRYVEDLTYEQIAASMGIPVGTIKVRLHRLRARLRTSLDRPPCPSSQTTPD